MNSYQSCLYENNIKISQVFRSINVDSSCIIYQTVCMLTSCFFKKTQLSVTNLCKQKHIHEHS